MNLFNYWDNGTWENQNTNVETDGKYSLVKSNDFAFGGSFSGKMQTLISGAPAIGGLILDLLSNITGANRFISLGVGKKYEIRLKLYIPSGSPIATDNVAIGVNVSGVGNIGVSSPPQNVATFKDNWVEIVKEIEIGTTPGNATISLIFLTVSGGTLILNGLAYIDDMSITELASCDLAFGDPQFTKSNETVAAANDGTITINATSSFITEYRLNGGAWQLSNLFENLAPGIYTPEIRDSNPENCFEVGNDITIQAGDAVPPPIVPSDDLLVDQKPVNDTNFLSWFASDGDLGFTNFVCSNQCWDIPNAYLNNKIRQPHYPIITPDETTSFYLNFSTLFNDSNHADFRLGMINSSGVQETDISDLNILFEEDGVSYDIWSDVDIPAIANGIYRFIIYNGASNAILFTSQEVQLMTSDYECVSTYIQFRNSLNLKGFRYQLIANFIQQFRMRLYEIDEQSEGDIAQYRSVSSGLLRNVHYDLDRYILLEAYYFDKLGHRAMHVFQVHDSLFVNGINYLLKTAYKSEANVARNTTKGTLELYDQSFSASDKFGVPVDLVIVGSDDDLLLSDNGRFIKL